MISRILFIAAGCVILVFGGAAPSLAQIDIGQVIDTVNDAASGEQEAGDTPVQESSPSTAQTGIAADGSTTVVAPQSVTTPEMAQQQMTQKASLLPQGLNSVVFTYWEYTAIMDAKRSRQSSGVQRGVTEDELSRALEQNKIAGEERPVPPPEEREISLGGIVYASGTDWTIWLNGQRVTPDALPKEIIDLRVSRHHIDVKWLDDYTQKLYPIRLRAHQRFNLDTRIFLPG